MHALRPADPLQLHLAPITEDELPRRLRQRLEQPRDENLVALRRTPDARRQVDVAAKEVVGLFDRLARVQTDKRSLPAAAPPPADSTDAVRYQTIATGAASCSPTPLKTASRTRGEALSADTTTARRLRTSGNRAVAISISAIRSWATRRARNRRAAQPRPAVRNKFTLAFLLLGL
jgi:hypothetical protein